jgi:hypothetical protein
LFEQNGRHLAGVQPNTVSHVAIDDDRPAFDHVDHDSLPEISLVDVEYQGFTHRRRFAADGDPFVEALAPHDDVAKDPQYAFSRFRHSESLFTSSAEHRPPMSNGDAARPEVAESLISGMLSRIGPRDGMASLQGAADCLVPAR